MPRILTAIVASFCLLTGLALAGEADLAKRIAPLIDAQTAAVAHVRLDKVDVSRLVKLAGKVVELPPADAGMAELAGTLAVTTLVNAGVKDVFVVVSLDGFPFEAFFVAIPVTGEAEAKKIATALTLGLKLRDAQAKVGWNEFVVQPGKDFVLIATKNALQRARAAQPKFSAHLSSALAAFPQADARLAVVLPDSLRRSLGELMPQLPREMGGAKTAPLLDGTHSFSAGITLAPKFITEASLRTDDPKTATALRTLLIHLMDLAAKEVGKSSIDAKILPLLPKVVALLTPSADKDVLRWKLTEDETIQAVKPLVVQIRAGSGTAQSMNHLKQIGLAMHSYHDVNKHLPTGVRDKKGKLLLSWRVQILPYVEEAPLYAKFKLDEPWDSAHNLPLAKQIPAVFRSPGSKAGAGKTTYLGPVGKGLFFDPAVEVRKFQDIADGTSNTIMVLEADDDHAVNWTAPDDLSVDANQSMKGVGGIPAARILALFGDGSVHALDRKLGPVDFYKLLTIAGGEPAPNFP